jgi:predicted acylesterase/phospholipase RssA
MVKARSALVLQGGGALGAFELGVARRLYGDPDFAPDLIAGVSIGAITAALLARPAKGLTPLQALERFWRAVAVSGWFLPPPLRSYASLLGNPAFYLPRYDFYDLARWTNLYDTAPLRATLAQLLDLDALADTSAKPGLLVTATDIEAGEIKEFYSGETPLTLDHILASGSLPPSFPMTVIEGRSYWDGGLFDNTPLGAILDRLDGAGQRTVYVINLFPNKAPVPTSFAQVAERTQNLQFCNKTAQDLKLLRRFDEVADLMEALEALAADHPVRQDAHFKTAYAAVKARDYVRVPHIVSITRAEQVEDFGGSDFSPETIARRAREGEAEANKVLGEFKPASVAA